MTIGSKEHYDILAMFEKNYHYLRLDREDTALWSEHGGTVYQSGETNELYKAFILGYSFARCIYQ